MLFRRRSGRIDPVAEPADLESAVADFEDQAALAARLSQVDTTHLHDHTTNPNTLARQNTLRDAADQQILELEHAERVRRARHAHDRATWRIDDEDRWERARAEQQSRGIDEAVADATEAADDLAAIRSWERETSPATAARTVSTSRARWTREFLAFSVIASAVSALGLAATVHALLPAAGWTGAALTGAAAEAILTLLVTRIIAHEAHLEAHTRADLPNGRRGSGYPWVLVAGLLATSATINAVGVFTGAGVLGAIGMVGAVVAAATAGMAWVASQAATDVITANVSEFRTANWQNYRNELRERAAGAYIPTRPGAPPQHGDGGQDQVRRVLEGLSEPDKLQALLDAVAARQLADHPVPDDPGALVDHADEGPGGDTTLLAPRPPEGNGTGPDLEKDTGEQPEVASQGQGNGTGSEQGGHPGRGGECPTGASPGNGTGPDVPQHREPHHLARAHRGLENRRRIADYLRAHPEAGTQEIARELNLARTTVRDHKRALREQDRI